MNKELSFYFEELLPSEDGHKAIILQCEWEWVRSYDFGGEYDGEVMKLKKVSWDGEDYTSEEKKLIKGWVKANWDMLNEESLCD
tara:strand:- start:132 stop:383 length:252 start_codon:yes stop_codon:yes gene_type:complete